MRKDVKVCTTNPYMKKEYSSDKNHYDNMFL